MTIKSLIISAIVIVVLIVSISFYIRRDPNDSLPENTIDFTSNSGKYPSFEVGYKDSNTVKITGRIVYDIFTVHEHFNLKNIDRDFVYRQVKSYCEANIIKVSYSEFKYSKLQVMNKIGYDLNRVGINVVSMDAE